MWRPNVHPASYMSDILGRKIKLRMTMKARRCIDKAYGFDNYILNTKPQLLGGEGSVGMQLQAEMRAVLKEQKMRQESEWQATHFGGNAEEIYNEKKAALVVPEIDPAAPVTEKELKLRLKKQKAIGRRQMHFRKRTKKGVVRLVHRKPYKFDNPKATASWVV